MNPDTIRTVAIVLTAALGVFTFYRQFFRFRGARLVVLDRRGSKAQKSTILKYSSLPTEIRNQYPDYRDPRGHHALVRIPVANEGDRAGYLKLLNVQIKSPSVQLQGIEKRNQVLFSYYTYTPVPAFGIGLQTILVRNLPALEVDTPIILALDLELGRVHPRSGKHHTVCLNDYEIEVVLRAPNPELSDAERAVSS